MIIFLCVLWCAMAPISAWGQEWQHYQLTDFPGNGQVRECDAVADSEGNFHIYYIAWVDPYLDPRLYYTRVSPWAHVLTDTVRLDDSTLSRSRGMAVVGDSHTSWCVWGQPITYQPPVAGILLAARAADGSAVLPTTLVAGGESLGGGPDAMGAALRVQDSTIHLCTGHYARITTSGDTVIWWRPLNDIHSPISPEIHVGPDGTPWAAMRSTYDSFGSTEIVLIRFGEDTSQTVYRPFGRDVPFWYVHEFGIDSHYDFHLLVSSDTCEFAYVRLDSALQIQEWVTLPEQIDMIATMKVDSLGNCMMVWNNELATKWAYRAADGSWPHFTSVIDEGRFGNSLNIVAMDGVHFAFVGYFIQSGESFSDLWLYTLGYPPDSAEPPHPARQNAVVRVYPNPFNFATTLSFFLPRDGDASLLILDIEGRLARTLTSGYWDAGEHRVAFDGTVLPTGLYFARLVSGSAMRTQKVVLLK